ncbi:hypothetical protein D3C83_71810 [compost metagenome]
MPSVATTPAPVSAPAMRAESWVVRWMLIAPINWEAGMISPTIAARIPMSDGRTRPNTAALTRTYSGLSMRVKASVITMVARVA